MSNASQMVLAVGPDEARLLVTCMALLVLGFVASVLFGLVVLVSRYRRVYAAARRYARLASTERKDRDALVARAVSQLATLRRSGYFTPAALARFNRDRAFDGVREHPVFASFLVDLDRVSTGHPGKSADDANGTGPFDWTIVLFWGLFVSLCVTLAAIGYLASTCGP